MSLYDIPFDAMDGTTRTLREHADDVVLVVNVASRCGLAPQYATLEAMHEKYRDRGFTVIGFPSNQFLQELGTNEAIQEFCSLTYGVTFPLTEKIEVNGEGRHALYDRLVGFADGEGHSGDIRWNFEKFLIGKDGQIAARFSPQTEPESAELLASVEKAVA